MDGQRLLLEPLPDPEDDLLHRFVPLIAQGLLWHRHLKALDLERLRLYGLIAKAVANPLERVDIQLTEDVGSLLPGAIFFGGGFLGK